MRRCLKVVDRTGAYSLGEYDKDAMRVNRTSLAAPRILLVFAGLTMALSSVMKEWRISIIGIVLLVCGLVVFVLNMTRDTSDEGP